MIRSYLLVSDASDAPPLPPPPRHRRDPAAGRAAARLPGAPRPDPPPLPRPAHRPDSAPALGAAVRRRVGGAGPLPARARLRRTRGGGRAAHGRPARADGRDL